MENVRTIDLGLGKVCRTCLTDEGDMKSVFSDTCNSSEVPIYKMLTCCTDLEVREDDGLPAVICASCELRLNNAYNYKQLSHKTNATLRKYVDSAMRYNVKQEGSTEEVYLIETADESFKSETANEIEMELSAQDDKEDVDDYDNDEASNDSDDIPLIKRQEKTKLTQFSADVVNQALLEARQRYNEKRECRLCGFISSNSRGLSLHIAHLHKELKDKWCNLCYEEVENLPAHMKDHSKVRSYVCDLCDKSFKSQGHLTEHIRSHSMERPYKCTKCDKGFLSARHLKVHERIHSGEKPFKCPYCGRRFTQKGSLQGHIRVHTGVKPFQCDVCDKRCTTSSALALHRTKTGHASFTKIVYTEESTSGDNLNVTVEEESVVVENVDMEQSDNKSDETVDTSPEPQPTVSNPPAPAEKEVAKKLCTVCGKTFSTASKLRLHMRVHTGETPYKCQYCDKRVSTRGQLVVHVRTHTGERPHVCHVCGKGFAQSSVLNTHMKLHTGRPEKCNICDQRFCRPAELRLHMRKHTGEKPYLCTECGQAFIQRSHLMEHIKIHSDVRPYKCNLCDRAFKQSSSLKSHTQIHSGFKPYKCSQCPYACRQPYSLTQHMKQHLDDAPQPHRPHVCLVCQKTFTTVAMLTSHSRSVHLAIF